MPIYAVPPEKLRRVCTPTHFDFETTAEVEFSGSIIGQPRGTRAIEFGIGIQSQGYNMYILGATGTGRATAIREFLRDKTRTRPVPNDWVYVNNFDVSHQPHALKLPAGQAHQFQTNINSLLDCIKDELPTAFDAETYRDSLFAFDQEFLQKQEALFDGIQNEASQHGLALVNTSSGPALAPADEAQELTEAQSQILQTLNDKLDDALYELRNIDAEIRARVRGLNHAVAAKAIEHHFVYWRRIYASQPDIITYLNALHDDVLDHLGDFMAAEEGDDSFESDLRRYQVNVLVDNRKIEGAPVVVERNPTYYNLIGRSEYEMHLGVMTTHFINLKAGSLHRANGGYLVISARDLLRDSSAWEALKRAIKAEEIRLQPPDAGLTGQALAKSLDPEPIPLNVKIILLGSPDLYYALLEQDEDFSTLFKVKADFDSMMPRDDEREQDYARFLAYRCQDEGLRHFSRLAVEKIVEFGSWLAEDQYKLSTRFGAVADLAREANYWAEHNDHPVIQAEDVQRALHERAYRSNRLEEQTHEQITEGTVFIATDGAVVGQVNALSVIDLGDHAFGQPGRITAKTYMGDNGVVNIDRETDMAGPLHNKGLMTLIGYLGDKYAQDQPLSFSASLTFEQSYSGIDGDSASAAELFVLLSSLSRYPIKQGVAVTGSINQKGEVQPVGGATEKVEGFFDICKARGLTGEQGVVIPASNIRHLMVREDVVEAVRVGQFHVWAMSTVDEGLEVVMGVPAGEPREPGELDDDHTYPLGTIHHAAKKRLYELAAHLKSFNKDEEE